MINRLILIISADTSGKYEKQLIDKRKSKEEKEKEQYIQYRQILDKWGNLTDSQFDMLYSVLFFYHWKIQYQSEDYRALWANQGARRVCHCRNSKDAYQGIGNEYETLLSAFDKHNADFSKRVGKDRSSDTLVKYQTVCNHLADFIS